MAAETAREEEGVVFSQFAVRRSVAEEFGVSSEQGR